MLYLESVLNLDLSEWSTEDLVRATLIRHVELHIMQAYAAGRVPLRVHTSLGQEYVGVAMSALMQPDDMIFSTHRPHAHYLALYDDAAGILADALGREGGVSGGTGRICKEHRFFSTVVPGETLSVAVGAAMQFARARSGQIAFVYVGDGSWGQGTLYEAMNVAQLWRLPLVIIVENNGISQYTLAEQHMAGTIEARAWSFGTSYQQISSIDVNMIRYQLQDSIWQMREGLFGPLLVDLETVRLSPWSHADDVRDTATRRYLWDLDWFKAYKALYPEQFDAVSRRTQLTVKSVAAEVEQRPPLEIVRGVA